MKTEEILAALRRLKVETGSPTSPKRSPTSGSCLTRWRSSLRSRTRCKDCKHKGWVQEPCHGKSADYCRVWDCTLRNLESTFCSYGEPKEGEHA